MRKVAKAKLVAVDIFTGKKVTHVCPCKELLAVPIVKSTVYQGVLPPLFKKAVFCKNGEPIDALQQEVMASLQGVKAGMNVIVSVISICGVEKIFQVRQESGEVLWGVEDYDLDELDDRG